MENGDQEATSTDQILVSENNDQKENAHENPINEQSEPDDSKTNGEPDIGSSDQTDDEPAEPDKSSSEQNDGEPAEPDKGSSEQPEDEPAKVEQTEPEKSKPEPEDATPDPDKATPVPEEPVVRPKEPRQSVNGAKKERKGEKEEEEDPNTAVYLNQKGDYEEYQHDDIEEIRKKELEIWVPGAMVLHHHFHQPERAQEESFLWLSVFTLIFFSRIFGAIALYKSFKVRLLHAEKKYKEEEEASKAAKKWNIVGMIFCLCWVILVIVILKGIGLFDESVDG